jgi:hypothetical protein
MDNPQTSTCSAGDLTDDLIVEILSRLPPKSICRFKCVSWHWYGLITDPEHRKKTPRRSPTSSTPVIAVGPQMISSTSWGDEEPFSNPSLTFMAGYRSIIPKICCNGLFFCLCWKVPPRDEADHVVCNPATKKWVVLPESGDDSIALVYRFGFDPAISPHFYVFQITNTDENYGIWIRR